MEGSRGFERCSHGGWEFWISKFSKNSKLEISLSSLSKNGCGKTEPIHWETINFRVFFRRKAWVFEKIGISFFGGAVLELDDSKGDFGALEGKKDEFRPQEKDQFDLLIQLLNTGVFFSTIQFNRKFHWREFNRLFFQEPKVLPHATPKGCSTCCQMLRRWGGTCDRFCRMGYPFHGNKNGLLFWILGISGDDRNAPSYWESLLDV